MAEEEAEEEEAEEVEEGAEEVVEEEAAEVFDGGDFDKDEGEDEDEVLRSVVKQIDVDDDGCGGELDVEDDLRRDVSTTPLKQSSMARAFRRASLPMAV